jgi:hypothetical protein
MATFNEFWVQLENELIGFAEGSLKTHRDTAIKDGRMFLEKTKSDLERWTKMLAEGRLTRDDFEWLVKGKKDLAELNALKQEGLAQVALDRFVNGLIDTVVSTAFKAFL